MPDRTDLTGSQLLAYYGEPASWTDISDYHRGDIPFRWGMLSNRPLDRVAQTGTMTFELINTTGRFTPGADAALAGWKKGVPVKLVLSYGGEDYTRWRGVIDDIDPVLGVGGEPYVVVSCVDWMDAAARTPLESTGIEENKTADEALDTLVALAPTAPQNTDFDDGVEEFPTVFDVVGSKTKLYAEFMKLALSEMGYIYLTKDKADGETLVFESVQARNGRTLLIGGDIYFALTEYEGEVDTFTLTIDNDMLESQVEYGKQLINRLGVYANPRRIDSSNKVLFSLDEPIRVASGETIEVSGTYTDPDTGLQVNAKDMQPPSYTTSPSLPGLTVTDFPYGPAGFTHTWENADSEGEITGYECEGKGIYIYNPVERIQTDDDSIDDYGYQNARLNQAYKNTIYSGAVVAKKIVEFYKTPRTLLNEVRFCANVSDEWMRVMLQADVGDRIAIKDDQAGIDNWHYIQGIEHELLAGGIIMSRWIVKEFRSIYSGGLTLLSVDFDGVDDGINYGYLPHVGSDDVQYLTISVWINLDALSTSRDNYIVAPMGEDTGYALYLEADPSAMHLAFINNRYATSPGKWTVDANFTTTGSWVHIFMTADIKNSLTDPDIYINNSAQAITEDSTPSGSVNSMEGCELVIGNIKTGSDDYNKGFDGEIADVRIYRSKLSGAYYRTNLYNNGIGGSLLATTVTYQAPCVRTEDVDDYYDETLDENQKLLDNIYGYVGTPNGSPTGRET